MSQWAEIRHLHLVETTPNSVPKKEIARRLKLERPLEPFQHAAFANVFDSLGAARNRVGNLLVGPPRSVRIGLQENLSAAHLLAAAVEFADRLLTDLAFLGGESNDVLFLRHESCLGSRSASR